MLSNFIHSIAGSETTIYEFIQILIGYIAAGLAYWLDYRH